MNRPNNTDKPNSAACDSLMGIFGYKRVKEKNKVAKTIKTDKK